MFLAGFLGGGDLNKLDIVKQVAAHFGLAFQIADDLNDSEQDKKNKRAVNIANVVGEEKAEKILQTELQGCLEALERLQIDSKELFMLTRVFSRS